RIRGETLGPGGPRAGEPGGECYLNRSCSTAPCASSMNLSDRAFLRAIGDRVRDRRTHLRLTQAELGGLCGLHRTFIGSVGRGDRNVSILNLRQIARVLRVSVADLLAGLGRLGPERDP